MKHGGSEEKNRRKNETMRQDWREVRRRCTLLCKCSSLISKRDSAHIYHRAFHTVARLVLAVTRVKTNDYYFSGVAALNYIKVTDENESRNFYRSSFARNPLALVLGSNAATRRKMKKTSRRNVLYILKLDLHYLLHSHYYFAA